MNNIHYKVLILIRVASSSSYMLLLPISGRCHVFVFTNVFPVDFLIFTLKLFRWKDTERIQNYVCILDNLTDHTNILHGSPKGESHTCKTVF